MKTEISIPLEVSHLLTERKTIWATYDSALKQGQELNSLAQKLGGLDNGVAVEPFTTNKVPPDEMARAITAAKTETANIAAAESEIQTAQSQIDQIKARVKMIYFGGGGAIATAIVIVIILLSSHH